MPKFNLVVDDTITLQRFWKTTVEADTEEAAKEIALDLAIGGQLGEPDLEEEVDNTPYSVELDENQPEDEVEG